MGVSQMRRHRSRTAFLAAVTSFAVVVAGVAGAAPAFAADTGVITGHLVDHGGHPIADAGVQAISSDFRHFGFARTGADGGYRMTDLAAGDYQVSFQVGSVTQSAHGQIAPVNPETFPVAEGQETVVDETLLPTGSISGRLTDATGQPLAHAFVSANDHGLRGASGSTGDDGTFRIS